MSDEKQDLTLGTFDNPICCKGVEGEHQYLGMLVGPEGAPITYRRVGSTTGGNGNILDKYEVSYKGLRIPLIIYMDMYAKGLHTKKPVPGLFLYTDFLKPKHFESIHYYDEVVDKLYQGKYPSLPNQYLYIYTKASLFLGRGPYIYARQDFYGLPDESWNLTAISQAMSQILHEIKGINEIQSIAVPDVETAIQTMQTFHFEPIENSKIKPNKMGHFSISAKHRMRSKKLELHFKISL